MKPKDAISLIQAAYRVELPAGTWLEDLAAAAAAGVGSGQAMAFLYDASQTWVNVEPPVLHGLSPNFAFDFFNQKDAPPEVVAAIVKVFLSIRFGALRRVVQDAGFAGVVGVLDRYGIDDMTCINGVDPSGQGCGLLVVHTARKYSPRTTHLWHRLAAHISAGNRLRATLHALAKGESEPTQRAEAILKPNGKIEHAVGPAESRTAREALQDALVRIDAARSERVDAGRCVDFWRGLVAGRWSLVEHFERDGKRYYLAHKNDPELTQDVRLTERERQVLGYADLGHSNKLIAYSLGLSPSTVSTLLASARRKVQGPNDAA